jgi:methyl-accepting chemotaxis protein
LARQVERGNQAQAEQTRQIAEAVSQMEQVILQAAAIAQQSPSAGEDLRSQSRHLKEIVDEVAAIAG